MLCNNKKPRRNIPVWFFVTIIVTQLLPMTNRSAWVCVAVLKMQ